MTDNEIIEALRYCGKIDNCLQCGKCPYFREVDCVKKNTNDVLDLINRQRAEIERLKKDLKDCIKEVAKSHEIDRNKAIKEFAERLKEMLGLINGFDYDCSTIFYHIDNLVKEMVGDSHAE